MPNNYIYLYHVPDKEGNMGVLILLPEYSDSVQDRISVSYPEQSILSRTAPIYAYSHSGPRVVQASFDFHRDMMHQINYGVSNAKVDVNDDYIDTLIKLLQATALPSYNTSTKLVNPPMVALRLGSDIFIKGVVTGGIGLTYKYPIIPGLNPDGTADESKQRYSNVSLTFEVSEVDPYDADTVMQTGSFRGLSTTLNDRVNYLYDGIQKGRFA